MPTCNIVSFVMMQHIYFVKESFNSLPTGAVCCYFLQTVWTQIRPDKMLGLTWIQGVWHSDGIPKIFFWKSWFWKKWADDKKHAKLPSKQRVNNLLVYFFCLGFNKDSWRQVLVKFDLYELPLWGKSVFSSCFFLENIYTFMFFFNSLPSG